jgi:hypothetical protein
MAAKELKQFTLEEVAEVREKYKALRPLIETFAEM